jgi:hypothetical protein
MKTALIAVTIFLFSAGYATNAESQSLSQTQSHAAQPPQGMPTAQPAANLNAVLVQIQQATSSTTLDIGRLRVEKWRTDSDQKQQLQHIAESLQKSIANALPVLITDVETSRGGVAASFKLYHNLNVVYENLNYLADVAGGLGKKEEFDPLAADCAALESARQNLSIYIEQSAVRLESANRQPVGTIPGAATQAQGVQGKKVVVINDDDDPPAKKPVKTIKKKPVTPPAAAPQPTPAQSASAPR